MKYKKFIATLSLVAMISFCFTGCGSSTLITYQMSLAIGVTDAFNTWFDTVKNKFSNTGDAFSAWLDNDDSENSLIGVNISKSDLKEYVELENSSYSKNKELNVEVTTTSQVSVTDGDSSSSGPTKSTQTYTFNLQDNTYDYRLPWQILLGIQNYTENEYSEEFLNNAKQTLNTTYYGLLEGDVNTPIDFSKVDSNSNFRFVKKVTSKETVVSKYTKKVQASVDIPSWVNDYPPDIRGRIIAQLYKDAGTVDKTYTSTTHTTTVIEYPLPYFTKIESLGTIDTFEYENKITQAPLVTSTSTDGNLSTTIETVTEEPVLKSQNFKGNVSKISQFMQSLNYSLNDGDLEYINGIVELLPNSSYACNLLNSLSGYALYGDTYFDGESNSSSGIDVDLLSSLSLSTSYASDDSSKWLTGDDDVNTVFEGRLAALASEYNKKIYISSGTRTIQEQQAFVVQYGSIIGNYIRDGKVYNSAGNCIVGKPGSSRHQYGLAADCSGWVKLLSNEDLLPWGLYKPMSYENWHLEPIETRKAA